MSTKKPQYGYTSGNKKPPVAATSTSENSILMWIILGLISLFLFWAPFQKGLFNGNYSSFEGPIYSSLVWTCVTVILFSIFLFYHWKMKTASDLMTIAIWLMPVVYLLSTIGAASSTLAFNMFYIQIIYVAFFLLAYYIAGEKIGLSVLKVVFIASSYLIVAFGLLNWLGQREGIFSLVKWFASNMGILNYYEHAVMEDSNGPRLTSVFQYANTYAGYLIAILLCAVHFVITSKRWYTIALHALFIVPIIISFFVTLSRGALVVLPIVVLLVLPFLKMYKQVTYLLHLLIAFILSFTILTQVSNAGVQLFRGYDAKLAQSGWTSLLIATAIYTALAVAIQLWVQPWLKRALDKLQQRRFSQIGLPIIAIVVGTLAVVLLFTDTGVTKALPDNIRTRIENINFQQHSVLERGTFYMDALKLFSDHPVMGAGGGAWAAMYEKYQNNPYTSRQAHSFYLQYMGETGLIGTLIFALILIGVLYIYIRNYVRQDEEGREERFMFYIAAIALLVHSALDFNLSYVYLGVVVFLCLGAMISNDTIKLKTAWLQKTITYKWIYPSALALIAVIMFFTSVQLVNAHRNYRETNHMLSNGVTDFNQIIAPLNQALETRPTQPEYVQQKAAILFQVYDQTQDEKFYNEAVEIIDAAREKNPYDFGLTFQRIQSYLVKENTQAALDLATAEISNFRWKVVLYQTAIDLNTRLGLQAFDEKDQATQDKYWAQALQIYSQFDALKQTLANLPKEQAQGNAFSVTPQMGLSLGEIYFLQGKYDQAEAMLRLGLSDNFKEVFPRQLARWYLAALQKQGKNDQALYDKLIAADANEKNEIQQLLSLKP
ncbi:O-antigen ligase family protein [Paenibacillus puerhi]|uniref:O-antigen ligase family protein n=1 Tax=Paenibacillus puerhi TaxID=2692622 RepID=UPI00135C3205|nr:O-antigen ligase family protein [Paenibacillus puerhi]